MIIILKPNHKQIILKINKTTNKFVNLNLNLLNDSRVIIFNSNLENINLYLNDLSNGKIKKSSTRYNENLITGCLSVLDSKLKNIKFFSNGTVCEDDLNFVRSHGSIKYIEIKNASSDAVDFDFSKIKIKDINITGAGNDCLDFSYGRYIILNANLNDCNDKAISVGEKSIFFGENISTYNSEFGLANKDSSKSYIKKISTEKVKICIDNYQKKKEFELGSVFIVNKECDIKKIKNLSFISKEDFYSKVEIYEKTGI